MKVGRPGSNLPHGGTIYPINIAWAATFDDGLALRAASQVGDEMRAQYNRRARAGGPLAYSNCFGPHVHIVRWAVVCAWCAHDLCMVCGHGVCVGCAWC